jgi:phosphoglycerate dehydrogenase-like enzyme
VPPEAREIEAQPKDGCDFDRAQYPPAAMKVVFCGSGWLPIVDAIRARLPDGATIRARDLGQPLVDEVRDAEVLLPSNARFDAAVIDAARRAVLLQQPAVGVDAIDLAAARARGIPVCNTPGTNGDSVAEATILLLLSLARRVPAARRAFAAATVGEPVGTELRGKTLGLVGIGRAGSRVAALAEAIGMTVLSVRSSSPKEAFEDLLVRSDYVSIHCPLTPQTRGLFGAPAFARMKPGACLVNVARGGVVDKAALETALASGRLAGAALDAFWEEPWDPSDPLFARDDVVVLPHVAGSTDVAFGRVADVVAENVRRTMRGEPLLHRVA